MRVSAHCRMQRAQRRAANSCGEAHSWWAASSPGTRRAPIAAHLDAPARSRDAQRWADAISGLRGQQRRFCAPAGPVGRVRTGRRRAVQTAARFCSPAARRVRRRQRRTGGAVRATRHTRGREGALAVRLGPTVRARIERGTANFPAFHASRLMPYVRFSPARVIAAAPHPPRACPRRAAQRAACRTRGTACRAARPAHAAP